MTNALISIIVPIYNTEKHLRRCISSICAQSYRKLEIILINDGSTDSSGIICNEFQKIDSRIRVIHKKNEGAAAARNTGLEVATGQYISFVDSDDWIKSDLIEYLYDILRKYNADLSIGTIYVIERSGKGHSLGGDGVEECLLPAQCLKKLLYHNHIEPSPCGKLYKKELFDGIRFSANKHFEDIGTIYKTIHKASIIGCGYNDKYIYCIHDGSETTSDFQTWKLDLLDETDKMGRDIIKWYPFLEKAVISRRVEARFSTLNQMTKNGDGLKSKRKEMISFIKSNQWTVLLDHEASKRIKIAILSLQLGWGFYKEAWKVYCYFSK